MKNQSKQLSVTPIQSESDLPDWVTQETAFTPIVAENSKVEEFRRLCTAYGVGQDLSKGCNYCLLQMRCLNVMRLNVPKEIRHFRQTFGEGKPFLSEAVRAITDSNIDTVLSYSLEDIKSYVEDGDPLNQERVLKLLGVHARDILKSVDPRIPILLLERLINEGKVQESNGVFINCMAL